MNNNNRFRPQGGQGWNQSRPYYQGGTGNSSSFNPNQPFLRDLVLGQAKINKSLKNKLAANDKSLETIQAKMDDISSSIKNQLSFNKMLETQLAQLAFAVPSAEIGKILGQPESSMENINVVTTRGGKTTRDPLYPDHASREKENKKAEEPPSNDDTDKVHGGKTDRHEFYDTQLLPFPTKIKRLAPDEQFKLFVDIIQHINISVPLLEAMQVPTYARYLKDILTNKRLLPTTEVIKLTEACSAAILQQLPEKKKDLGCPTISCSIGTQNFDKALCDLGASVSVMPKAIFYRLNYSSLTPTPMQLQLVDSSVQYPEGIV
jgi:hypothetical protein